MKKRTSSSNVKAPKTKLSSRKRMVASMYSTPAQFFAERATARFRRGHRTIDQAHEAALLEHRQRSRRGAAPGGHLLAQHVRAVIGFGRQLRRAEHGIDGQPPRRVGVEAARHGRRLERLD